LVLKKRTSDQTAVAQRRIIAFVGSPLKESEKEMKKIGGLLKKNGILIDIVNFGETKKNTKLLQTLIEQFGKDEGWLFYF
jgi:hypothetical protein